MNPTNPLRVFEGDASPDLLKGWRYYEKSYRLPWFSKLWEEFTLQYFATNPSLLIFFLHVQIGGKVQPDKKKVWFMEADLFLVVGGW